MATSRNKFKSEQVTDLRKFLEARGIETVDGRGESQFFRAVSPVDGRYYGFNFNDNGVTYSNTGFDGLIDVFNAPVVDVLSQHESDLLDDFAIAALQGICSNDGAIMRFNEIGMREMISPEVLMATGSYKIAQAMLAERAKHQTK